MTPPTRKRIQRDKDFIFQKFAAGLTGNFFSGVAGGCPSIPPASMVSVPNFLPKGSDAVKPSGTPLVNLATFPPAESRILGCIQLIYNKIAIQSANRCGNTRTRTCTAQCPPTKRGAVLLGKKSGLGSSCPCMGQNRRAREVISFHAANGKRRKSLGLWKIFPRNFWGVVHGGRC